ncbi:protein kinase domain containing protein [Stylonychia lemnae]|uniref:non-specific serine/threonine protein kinase n=1 Tax=Stylonychia lemnae TaxID=5949 RepID=A0A077ZVT1_STYLE|nr:protein kinase domain containing protein [Stylonychia lemnae]|eukprot:CDW72546.1 protein kinase domain containing protein [Stylonychia lemnae]
MQKNKGKHIGNRYRIVKQIGEGLLTEVYQVEDERSNQTYAMKVIAEQGNKNKKQLINLHLQTFEMEFKREASFLRNMNHPHIIKMVHSKMNEEDRPKSGESGKSNKSNSSGSGEENEQNSYQRDQQGFDKYIILELAENGDLFDFVVSTQEGMGEELSRFYFQQILSAVEYLHLDQKIIHRDLKLENILVDGMFNLKICDLTLAKTIQEGSVVGVFYSQVGTERYMAPEILLGQPYKGNTTDIFALGVILFIMVTGVMPFYQKATKSDPLYSLIYKNDEKGYWEALLKTYQNQQNFNANLSDEFKKFVWQFFSFHYFERITLDKIKGNKWFQQEIILSRETVLKEMTRRKQNLDDKYKNNPTIAQQRIKNTRMTEL